MINRREIKVILFSDVVNSSGEMFLDERDAVLRIHHDLELFSALIGHHSGSLVKNTGDGILATFDNTTTALEFLREVLRQLSQKPEPRLHHRFGLHIGEIYVHGDDIIGQGVNLASRLQGISPVDGVAFTQATHANLDPLFRRGAVGLGSVALKGVPDLCSCYALSAEALLGQVPAPQQPQALAPLRRLIATNRLQQAIGALLLMLAAANDLDPANPLQSALLDRRLMLQRQWRELTGQWGPQAPPLPVVLVDAPEERSLRRSLASLLRAMPPERYPVVALDFVFDRAGREPEATRELTEVIARQRRPRLDVGYFGALTNSPGAGNRSRPSQELLQAGVVPRDLSTGTDGGSSSWPTTLKPTPLQLVAPLGRSSLAAALAGPAASLPAVDAVIDWSLPWERLIRVWPIASLPQQQAPVTLVGYGGSAQDQESDLFQTPAAFLQQEPIWQGQVEQMPGVIVQAALAQSLRLGHWLTPLSSLVCTALACAGGVLLSNAGLSRRRRRRLVLLTVALSLPLVGQLAVGASLLVPIVLPALGLIAMSTLREGR